MKPKFTATFYEAPAIESPQRLMFREFYSTDDKTNWLMDNRDMLEKNYNINVLNLINAHMNDDWPQKREKKEAN